jgi:hypothetical protein
VMAMARSMMKSKGMPGRFWGEVVIMAVYLLNRTPTKSVVGMTPYEAWYRRKPSVDYLRTFRCVAHVKTVAGHTSNLADQSTPMVMIGYEAGTKAYRAYNPMNKKLVVTRDVIFDEKKSWNWSSVKSVELISDEISTVVYADDQDAGTHVVLDAEENLDAGASSAPSSDGTASRATHADESASGGGAGTRGGTDNSSYWSGARGSETGAGAGARRGDPAHESPAPSSCSPRRGSQPSEPARGARSGGPGAGASPPRDRTDGPESNNDSPALGRSSWPERESARAPAGGPARGESGPAGPGHTCMPERASLGMSDART